MSDPLRAVLQRMLAAGEIAPTGATTFWEAPYELTALGRERRQRQDDEWNLTAQERGQPRRRTVQSLAGWVAAYRGTLEE